MHAIELVQLVREVLLVGEQFRQHDGLAITANRHIIDELGSQASRAPQDTGIWCRAVDDGLPLRFEEWEIMIAEPIHMVEQHEARDLPVVLAQKSFDGVGLDREAIESAISEFLEVVGLEVLRAAVGGVRTGDVDPPKVIVLEGDLGKHGIDGILDELDDSAWILFVDLAALGFGDS